MARKRSPISSRSIVGVVVTTLISGALVLPLLTVGPAGASSGLKTAESVSSRQAHKVLLKRKFVKARRGGVVKARGGAVLKIPGHALRRNGYASIWRLPNGHYDFRVSVKWRGKVRVTVPGSSAKGVVMHSVNGTWRIESTRPGKATVWVRHLSPFDFITCFSRGGYTAIAQCLLEKNIKSIQRAIAAKILGDATSVCWPSSWLSIPVHLILDPNCVGQVGEGDYTNPPDPPNPPPTPQPTYIEPNFGVMNTSEQPPDGIWFRSTPQTSDTPRITGHGVYAGDVVHVYCYAWGDSVGAYGNQIWYYAANLTRPTVLGVGSANVGWINTHYINDGMTANHSYSGVRTC